MKFKNYKKRIKYNKNWRRKNPLKVKKYYKTTREKSQKYISELKNYPCEDCGKKYHYFCMEFDHVPERGKKEFNCDSAHIGMWCKFISELFKCDLVCANCHRIREYKRRK